MMPAAGKCPFHDTSRIAEFDALDPEARSDPHPYYDWLRDSDLRRVYPLPHESAFFMVHRYEDVRTVLTDPVRFSSEILPVKTSPFFALMDGADHKRIRQAIAPLFTPEHLQLLVPEIQQIVSGCTQSLLSGKPVALFNAWGDAIPLKTLALLFGFDRDDTHIQKLHADAIAINRALFVTGGTGPRRNQKPDAKEKFYISIALLKHAPALFRLRKLLGKAGMHELIRAMRPIKSDLEFPRPDFTRIPNAIGPLLNLFTHFATVLQPDYPSENKSLQRIRESLQKGDASLTEMVLAGAFILFAGYETTASLLSNCVVHLSKNPALFTSLKKNPERLEDFIEESLRFYTPVGRFLRRATADVQLGDCLIPKDAFVVVMPGAANTDPERFPDGCMFDMARENNRQHLSFGKGIHFCIGAPLARLQVTCALQALLQQARSVAISDPQSLKMVTDRDNGILRYEQIVVQVTPD